MENNSSSVSETTIIKSQTTSKSKQNTDKCLDKTMNLWRIEGIKEITKILEDYSPRPDGYKDVDVNMSILEDINSKIDELNWIQEKHDNAGEEN